MPGRLNRALALDERAFGSERVPRSQTQSIRGKTHVESWRSVFHVDLFSVFHPLFSFPSYFHAFFSASLFSAGLSGAQQVRLHSYLGLESARRLDLYRLDCRLGLGTLIGAATAGRGPGTACWPCPTRFWNNLFLQRLRKVLRRGSPLLQFLRRRPAGYAPVMRPDYRVARRGSRKWKKASGFESRHTCAFGECGASRGPGSGRVNPFSSTRRCMA